MKRRRRLSEEQRELAARYMPLAEAVARTYSRRFQGPEAGEFREEIYGAALLALCRAAEKFDPARGVKFSTYAIPSINRFIWLTIRLLRARGLAFDAKRCKVHPVGLSLDVPGAAGDEPPGRMIPDPAGPVGWEVESEDAVRVACARAGSRGAPVLAYFLDAGCGGSKAAAGATVAPAASSRRHNQIVDEGLALIRKDAQARG